MSLDSMLFAYGKGKPRTTKARMDLKRNELSRTLSESVLLEEAEHIGKQQDLVEKCSKSLNLGRSRTRRNILRDRGIYQQRLTEALVIRSIFDIFNESLLLDPEFKETYRGNLYKLTEDTFKSMIKEKGVTIKDLKRNSSAIMSEIIEICENYAEKSALNAYPLNEAKCYQREDIKQFELDDEGDFCDDKEFASKNIATIVKNKVIKVISDEKKSSEEHEEFKLSIEDELDDTSDITDEEILDGLEEEDSELSESPKADDAMNDNSDITNQKMPKDLPDIQTGGSTGDNNNNATKSESYRFRNVRLPKKKKLSENTLFNAITLSIAKKNTMELKSLSEDGNIELDMNLVFAESIAHYTLLETLYTTKLLDVTPSEARSLAISLLV